MASELERKLTELEGPREERCCGVDECEGARRGSAGAMVSPSMPGLSPTSVVSLLGSTSVPHPEQYRLASAISLEQEGQRMGAAIVSPRPRADCQPVTRPART